MLFIQGQPVLFISNRSTHRDNRWCKWCIQGLSSKIIPKGAQRSLSVMSLKEGLESHLLHVLECLTLQLLSYLYKSPTNLSTHTNSVACIINYQRLSSLHFLFRREPTFALPVEMTGEQNGDSKLEVRNTNVCLSL